MPTTVFSRWDVVTVPFPFVERSETGRRPALVVSLPALQELHGLLWVAMITSADNPPWPLDARIDDLEKARLPAPSVVRAAKMATVPADRCDRRGTLAVKDRNAVAGALRRYFS